MVGLLTGEKFPTSIFESLLLTADFHFRQEKYKHQDGYNLYDRDFISILSYQRMLLENDYPNFEEFYRPFKECVLFNLKPVDLLVYVHVPIELSLKRIFSRDHRTYNESDKTFLQNIKLYLEEELLHEMENERGIKVLKLDGRNLPDANVNSILREINYEKN